ncbi:MAG: cytochrome c [Rhodospirillales bacterium]|nr:cytochrome c [Rhodospirillales bacterium]
MRTPFHTLGPALAMALVTLSMTVLAIPAAADLDRDDEAYHRDYIYGVPAQPTEEWVLASGARLYDNWINALDADKPESTHPAWPASNTKKEGAVTWRCKSCHGWDYNGKDGAYAKGSYQTGIKGVRASVGKDPAEIAKIVRGPVHGITEQMIPDDALMRLATFVSRGQVDMAAFVAADKSVKGNAARGAAVFQNVCASCHGFDGTALNWGDDEEPGYVGTEAQANPWEVLHKIRAGHPGVEMVSLMAFRIEDAVDVLAYARTLPAK